MGGRSIAILGAAVVCGLVAMFGASQLLTKKERPPEMRDVVVAVRDVKVEEVLKEDMLTVVKMPKEAAPIGCFSSPSEILDRWVQITTLKDEPILAAKLAPKDSPPGLIGRIPDGMRAFAIEVNEQTGVSGFILPDHRVDVIQDLRDDRSSGNKKKARIILQNVQVLAAGQVISRPEDKSIVVRTVTLAVMPEQVEVLVSARSKGPLALALRGLNDEEIVEVEEPKEESPKPLELPKPEPRPLVAIMPPRPPVPAARARHVVIHHGLRRTDLMRIGGGRSTELVHDGTIEARTSAAPSGLNALNDQEPPSQVSADSESEILAEKHGG